MEKTNIAIEKKYLQKTHKSTALAIDKNTVFFSVLAFFCARCEILSLGSIPAFALAASLLYDTKKSLPAYIFIPLGILSKGYYAQLKTDFLISIFFLVMYFFIRKGIFSGILCSLSGALVCICGKLFFPYIFNLTPNSYSSLIASGIGVFLLTLVFFKANLFLRKDLSRKTYLDMAAFFILSAFSVSGLFYIIKDIPLYLSAAALFILSAGFFGGPLSGTFMGIFMGLILSLSGVCQTEIFPVITLFGVFSGFIRQKGKIFTAIFSSLVFSVSAVYYLPGLLNFSSGALLAAAASVFVLIPLKDSKLFHLPLSNSDISDSEHISRIKRHAENLLSSASTGFDRLSHVFKEDPNTSVKKYDLSDIMSRVKKRSCRNCGMAAYCWGRDLEKTKRIFSNSFSVFENKGLISTRDFKKLGSDFCIEPENLLSAINKEYEIHKRDAFWQMKLKENRYILKEELSAFSKILRNLSSDLSKSMEFKPELEKKAAEKLRRAGLSFSEVSIWENSDGSKNASIKMLGCSDSFVCTQKIIPIMNKVMDCSLRQKSRSCRQINKASCFIELESVSGLTVFAGACTWGKDANGSSGDCYSIMDMPNKKILALSDGMGYGIKASLESRKVMELLELLIDSGLSEDFSVKLINSSLVPQNTKENFSTLDVCVIDRITGSGYFLKAGASSAYIVRGNRIKSIKSSSLPVGIIAEASTEKLPVHIKPGDIIIMVTDGVWDIIEKKGGQEWLYSRINEINSKNPSALSEFLLNEARSDAVPFETDDMTVLCAKVWGEAV